MTSLESLESQLELFIENLRQFGIIVTDFQPQGQTVLNSKIDQIVSSLQEIEKNGAIIPDIKLPLEVFDYIDQGKNPQLYTKDCLEKTLINNELSRGKIDATRRFKTMLQIELSKAFPNDMARYRAIRGDERVS